MAARKRKPTNSTRNGTVDPSKPLAKPSRELFAQDVAAGVPVKHAYLRAGYEGNDVSRYELRRCADIDARVNWLLARRIESDTKARHRVDQKISDARLRLIRELERIAYSDVRDVVQWDRELEFDQNGNVIGFKDAMKVTPSHLLSREQATQVRSVTTKSGALKFEVHDKLAALAQLAKILGVAPEPQPQTVNNATVNVTTINLGRELAGLVVARRLAFVIERAARAAQAAPVTIEGASHAPDAPPKG